MSDIGATKESTCINERSCCLFSCCVFLLLFTSGLHSRDDFNRPPFSFDSIVHMRRPSIEMSELYFFSDLPFYLFFFLHVQGMHC